MIEYISRTMYQDIFIPRRRVVSLPLLQNNQETNMPTTLWFAEESKTHYLSKKPLDCLDEVGY